MTSIFLSYAREDEDEARRIAWELEMRGANVWWDRHLESGEPYIEAILRQVDLADYVLLVLSRCSAVSPWVAFEIGATRMREVGTDREILRIAHIDDSDPPGFIGERQATPMTHGGVESLAPTMGLPQHVDWKPPAGRPDVSLTVFRAGAQWMELVNDFETLTCVLVDAGERRARIQWRAPVSEAREWVERGSLNVEAPQDDRGWSRFDLGRFREWRWTPALFPARDGQTPSEQLAARLRELITRDHS